jgi:PAS domain S-box-containing protein
MSDTPPHDPNRQTPPELVLETLLGDGAEHAEIGLFIYDDRGRYLAVNRAAAELLGHDRSELLHRDVGEFTEGGIDRSLLQKRDRREGVRIVERKDGTRVPVAFVVSPTRVGGLWFSLAVVWELEPDDPRGEGAR